MVRNVSLAELTFSNPGNTYPPGVHDDGASARRLFFPRIEPPENKGAPRSFKILRGSDVCSPLISADEVSIAVRKGPAIAVARLATTAILRCSATQPDGGAPAAHRDIRTQYAALFSEVASQAQLYRQRSFGQASPSALIALGERTARHPVISMMDETASQLQSLRPEGPAEAIYSARHLLQLMVDEAFCGPNPLQ